MVAIEATTTNTNAVRQQVVWASGTLPENKTEACEFFNVSSSLLDRVEINEVGSFYQIGGTPSVLLLKTIHHVFVTQKVVITFLYQLNSPRIRQSLSQMKKGNRNSRN